LTDGRDFIARHANSIKEEDKVEGGDVLELDGRLGVSHGIGASPTGKKDRDVDTCATTKVDEEGDGVQGDLGAVDNNARRKRLVASLVVVVGVATSVNRKLAYDGASLARSSLDLDAPLSVRGRRRANI